MKLYFIAFLSWILSISCLDPHRDRLFELTGWEQPYGKPKTTFFQAALAGQDPEHIYIYIYI